MEGVDHRGERCIVITVDVVCLLESLDEVEFKVFIDELGNGLVGGDSAQPLASHG